ncbi:MAG TPA: hypothetical protein VFJ62_01575 [Usitatibacter sp.]|nr:hypothetical protein [Usitatibacter sp.]
MKITRRTIALALTVSMAAPFAHADAYDCFPTCPPAPAAVEAKPASLCDNSVVREAVRANARLDEQLEPVKEVYEMATNPTGYAIRMVDQHVVHIPKVVGYALDPRGAVKAELTKRARAEFKKRVGLANECREAAPAVEQAPAEGAQQDLS